MLYSTIIGLTYAIYLIGQKKNTGFDKFLLLNFHIAVSALILLPFFPIFAGPVPTTFKFYFYVEIIAIIYTIIPLFLNLYALGGIKSSTVGMMLNINPIIAFVLSGVIYHESLSKIQLVAYGLIFIAVLVYNLSNLFAVKPKRLPGLSEH